MIQTLKKGNKGLPSDSISVAVLALSPRKAFSRQLPEDSRVPKRWYQVLTVVEEVVALSFLELLQRYMGAVGRKIMGRKMARPPAFLSNAPASFRPKRISI